jgi:hypothetical protein
MAHSYDDLIAAIVELTTIFENRRLNYVLIGGLAVSQLTQPRFTKDVDFLIEVPKLQLPGVLEDIAAKGGDLDLIPSIKAWNTNHMLVFQFNGIRVDWLKPVIPAYSHVITHGILTTLESVPIRIASTEGLILLKLLAFRPQDKLDIESLVAAKQHNLEVDWIDSEWQTIGELTDPPMIWFKERYQHITSGGS